MIFMVGMQQLPKIKRGLCHSCNIDNIYNHGIVVAFEYTQQTCIATIDNNYRSLASLLPNKID